MAVLEETESGAAVRTRSAQNEASRHTDQEVSGTQVRTISGAQLAIASRMTSSVPGEPPFREATCPSLLTVMMKKMKANSMSAATTRSSRPRRCHFRRGRGGSVTPASTVAAMRLRRPETRVLRPENMHSAYGRAGRIS